MRKSFLAVLCACSLFVGAHVVWAQQCNAPQPPVTFQMTKPAATIDPKIAVLNGVWAGTWRIDLREGPGLLCVRLYVAVQDNAKANIAYCRGSMFSGQPFCRTWNEVAVSPGVLQLSNLSQTFKVKDQNTLSGEGMQRSGIPMLTDFKRLQ